MVEGCECVRFIVPRLLDSSSQWIENEVGRWWPGPNGVRRSDEAMWTSPELQVANEYHIREFMMETAWWAVTVGAATRTLLAVRGGGGCRRWWQVEEAEMR
jgi:hypothetical protein